MSEFAQKYQELYDRLVSPVESFYKHERERPNAVCYVQPYPDGSLVEYTWAEVGQKVRSLAAYLKSLNFEPGSRIALLSTNCAYWIISDLAIWMAGHVSVPIYPVLTAKSIKQILDHSEASAIFVGKLEGWEGMQDGVADHIAKIGFPLSPQSVRDNHITVDKIFTEQAPLTDNYCPALEDVATIIYTSGTTGMPKGVMHSFRNLALVGTLAGEMYDVGPNDRKLSYLPLAHVAERASIEVNQMYYGYTLYFANTLETFADDLRRARPTIFVAVPRIWLKLQQRVLEKVNADDLQALLADENSREATQAALLGALGLDELRIGLSGAAPLSTALSAWYLSLGVELLECYAMSENFAYSHATRSGEAKIGYVGTPCNYVTCKLSEVGEILIHSPATMLGYYKEPGKTAEAINEDGFLHTGDKGQFDELGRLRITGRVKELFKTSKGKFVAPAPIEDMLMHNLAVEHVCVMGSGMAAPIALIVLSEAAVELPQDEVKASLGAILKSTNSQLDKHENLSHIAVMKEEWTVENSLMTPTLKVKRAELESRYADQIEGWATQPKGVVFEI